MKTICLMSKDLSIHDGARRVLSILANELSSDYRVVVYSILFPEDGEVAYPFSNQVKVYLASKGEKRIDKALLQHIGEIRRNLAKEKVELILAVGVGACPAAFAACVCSRRKYVVCEHTNRANLVDRKRIRGFYEWLGAKTASKIVTLTETDCLNYSQKYHTGKVCSIYNWIDTEKVTKSSGYRTDAKKILTVGRLSRVKGFDLLLEVASRVLPSHPDWEWHIYGDGPMRPEIEKGIQERSISDQLILKGYCEDIYDVYPKYGIYVMTSYHEGLPLVLLEAQANFLPVVSFDCVTGPGEIVTDKENGYLIPPYDINKMADRIAFLMDHEEKRIQFSAHSCDNLAKFKKEKILQQWKKLVDELTE